MTSDAPPPDAPPPAPSLTPPSPGGVAPGGPAPAWPSPGPTASAGYGYGALAGNPAPQAQYSPDGAWMWNGYQWVPTGPAMTAVRPFRSPRGISSVASVLLGVGALATLFLGVASYHRHSVADRILGGDVTASAISDASHADDLVTTAAAVYLLALVAGAIAFLTWLHRVSSNLPALGARELRFSPGWAVGWFFIPFANLVQPVRAVGEAWRASDPGVGVTDRNRRQGLPLGPVPVWWVAYLLSGLVVGGARTTNGTSLDDLRTLDAVRAVASLGGVLAAVLAIVVVRSLTARQETKVRAFAEGRLPG